MLLSKPRTLPTIRYQAPGIGYFPLLKDRIKHLFTWGLASQNMSKIVGPDKENAWERVKKVLGLVGMETPGHTMLINPNGYAKKQILEISKNIFEGNTENEEAQTYSNFVYTSSSEVAIMVKPGDCPVAIISATFNGKPLIGLLHAGRNQLDIQLPKNAIQHLVGLGCNSEEIFIGITPSISKDNYYISNKDIGLLKNYKKWEERKRLSINTIKQTIHLDLLGFLIDQLLEAGISPGNIEAYSIDTLFAAKRGEGFSQRYASYTKKSENNGRYLVAVQI